MRDLDASDAGDEMDSAACHMLDSSNPPSQWIQ